MINALDIPALEADLVRWKAETIGERHYGYEIDPNELRALIVAAKERDLFADEMSKRGLVLDAALAEIVSLRAKLEQAEKERDELIEAHASHADGYADAMACVREQAAQLAALRAKMAQAERALNEIASMDKFTSSTGAEENKAVTISVAAVAAIHEKADGKWDSQIAPCPMCGFHVETVQRAPTFIIEE